MPPRRPAPPTGWCDAPAGTPPALHGGHDQNAEGGARAAPWGGGEGAAGGGCSARRESSGEDAVRESARRAPSGGSVRGAGAAREPAPPRTAPGASQGPVGTRPLTPHHLLRGLCATRRKGSPTALALAPLATLLRLAHVQPVHRPHERDKSGSAAKPPVDDDLPRVVIQWRSPFPFSGAGAPAHGLRVALAPLHFSSDFLPASLTQAVLSTHTLCARNPHPSCAVNGHQRSSGRGVAFERDVGSFCLASRVGATALPRAKDAHMPVGVFCVSAP